MLKFVTPWPDDWVKWSGESLLPQREFNKEEWNKWKDKEDDLNWADLAEDKTFTDIYIDAFE